MLRPKDRRKWFFRGAVLEVQDHMVLHKYHKSSFWSLKSAYLLSTIHIKISPTFSTCPVFFEKQRGSIASVLQKRKEMRLSSSPSIRILMPFQIYEATVEDYLVLLSVERLPEVFPDVWRRGGVATNVWIIFGCMSAHYVCLSLNQAIHQSIYIYYVYTKCKYIKYKIYNVYIYCINIMCTIMYTIVYI